jgi:hypothetical protein
VVTTDRAVVPLLIQLPSYPLHWALLAELAASNHRARELAAPVDQRQNWG